MRLTPMQIQILKKAFNEVFGTDASLMLFGSRVDDNRHGGDIDLYVTGFDQSIEKQLKAKLKFLAKVKQQIGEQRIDLVFSQSSDQPVMPIHKIAEKTGVEL
jgi:predicted nucleotidyltransferase